MAKNRTEAPNRRRSLSDPLAAALLPPANETPVEKELRLKRETEAKQVSDRIDELIRQERIHRKKTRAEVNVLLLGQSESGKSTTLKRKSRLFYFLCPYSSGSRHNFCRVMLWGTCSIDTMAPLSPTDNGPTESIFRRMKIALCSRALGRTQRARMPLLTSPARIPITTHSSRISCRTNCLARGHIPQSCPLN